MKKLILIILIGGLFIGCSPLVMTYQDLSLSSNVKAGMTTDEVRNILGEPFISELDRNVEEWHYCKTARLYTKDEFLAVFFVDNKLVAKQFYFGKDMAWGDCSRDVKTGDYKVPPEVQAILDKK